MKALMAILAAAAVSLPTAAEYQAYLDASADHQAAIQAEIQSAESLDAAAEALAAAQQAYDAALANWESAKADTDDALTALNAAHEVVRPAPDDGG